MKSYLKTLLQILLLVSIMLSGGTSFAVPLQPSGPELPSSSEINLISKKEIPHHAFLAGQYLKAGQYQDVITVCQQILEFEKDHISAHAYLAAAYKGLDKISEYQVEAEQVKRLAPKSSLLYQALANLNISQQNYKSAEKNYMQGIETATNTAELRMGLANLYLKQNHLTKAENEYLSLLKLKNIKTQFFLNANFALCRIGMNVNAYEKVIERAKILIDLYPPLPQGHKFLAAAYLAKGQPHQAIKVLEKYTTTNPKVPEPYHLLTSIYINNIKEIESGIHYASIATKRFPYDAMSWDALGWALFKNSQNNEALKALEQAVAIEKNNPRYLYHLGLVQQKLGKKELGRKNFEMALIFINPEQAKGFARELKTRIKQCQ